VKQFWKISTVDLKNEKIVSGGELIKYLDEN
jgi:hypothetical protein